MVKVVREGRRPSVTSCEGLSSVQIVLSLHSTSSDLPKVSLQSAEPFCPENEVQVYKL